MTIKNKMKGRKRIANFILRKEVNPGMLVTIFLVALGVLMFRGIFAILGFVWKTIFWVFIGIPAAIIFFSFGMALVGAIILVGCLVVGIFIGT